MVVFEVISWRVVARLALGAVTLMLREMTRRPLMNRLQLDGDDSVEREGRPARVETRH